MHLNDSRVTFNSKSNKSSLASSSGSNKSNKFVKSNNTNSNNLSREGNRISNISRQDKDGNSASVMSNLSSYSLIDDDHIDDQETINVGNLIIDLESDLEKEKIENEQANNAKLITCTTTSAPSSSSTVTSFGGIASSSTGSANNVSSGSTTNTTSGKSNQKSSNKHSNISTNSATSSSSNNNSSSVNNVSTIDYGVSNNNINTNNNGHVVTTRTVFKSSADERGDLKMRITRETKPGKSEHKIVTSPNQKSPTSSSGSNSNSSISNNNNTTSQLNNCEDIILHDSASKPSQSSSISSTKECGTSTSIGTITEPDCLGPCEPGTSVTLEGIVWQETEGGILVVNVTWRGKTYVGALLDCTKHDWAPPRLCDSPVSDIDSKVHKGVRTKRIVTRSNGIGLDEKNLLQTTGKLRNGKGRRILTSNDIASCNKRQRESDKSTDNVAAQPEANTSMANVSSITNSENACVPMNIDTTPATNNESISTSNILADKGGPNSPMLIGCSEPNCSKKYRNMNGLLYHQAHAHGTDNDSNTVQENDCSSSSPNEKVKTTTSSSKDHADQADDKKTTATEINDLQSPTLNELKPNQDIKLFQAQERRRTPSPQLSLKMSNKIPTSDLSPNNNNVNNNNSSSGSGSSNNIGIPLYQEPRANISRYPEPERRSSLNSNHRVQNIEHNRRSPPPLPPVGPIMRHPPEHGHGSSNNHSSSKPSSSGNSKQSNNPNLPYPVTTEEGMKPSGTSTGPPPAPHQANCYFNSAFLANTFNPYGLAPYFTRPPLPMYDPLAPPTSTANAAFISRFMNNMRVPPPPESPSRLLSPSISKNLPFPHFKVDPGAMPVPAPQMASPSLPNISPLTNPPLASSSPHLRMPSQGDPMLPPTSQPPFPHPVGLNPMLGLPVNPMGPIGGPQVPSLVDDPLAKQFPRRFN